MTVEQIIETVMRDRVFYGKEGGITVSGGEPMFQPEGCITILRSAKKCGVSTAIETCVFFPKSYLGALSSVKDLFLLDIKDGKSKRHMQYTGVKNEKIIENLFAVDAIAKKIIIRCIMVVRGANMDTPSLDKIANIYINMKHCIGVELIPYHAYAGSKAEQLGRADNGRKQWIPTDTEVSQATDYLRLKGVRMI